MTMDAIRKRKKRIKIKKPEFRELYEKIRRMNKEGKKYLRERLYDKAIERFEKIREELGGRRLPSTDFAADADRRIEYCEEMKRAEYELLQIIFSLVYDVASICPHREVAINMKKDIFRRLPHSVPRMPKRFYDFIDRAIEEYGLPIREDDVWSRGSRTTYSQPVIFYTSIEELEEFAKTIGLEIPQPQYIETLSLVH